MTNDEKYIKRCIEIAGMGLGNVAPNPLVGSVIVYDDKIIGEGYHQNFGGPHAEVNAILSAEKKNSSLLTKSTLYVNLEPCCHFGKTPPCTDLIILKKIPRVVIGCLDSFDKVSGKGIEKLKSSGCEVKTNILEKESRILNQRFFTFHEKKRPYIILKWAQTKDGFIAGKNSGLGNKSKISGNTAQILLHKWRSEEQAIMVGTNTARFDNPKLNVRNWTGISPLRIVIDKNLRLPSKLYLFDQTLPTLVFTAKKKKSQNNLIFSLFDFSKNIIPRILEKLYLMNIQSVIIEGGTILLSSFIREGIWDEARVFTSNINFLSGIKGPLFQGKMISKEKIGGDELSIYINSEME